MLQCNSTPMLIQAELDGELEASRQAELEAHVDQCSSCQAERDEQRQLRDLFAEERASLGNPPADLADQVMAGLAAAPAPAPQVHSFSRWAARLKPAALAASVLIAVSVSFHLGRNTATTTNDPNVDTQRELVEKGITVDVAIQLLQEYQEDREAIEARARDEITQAYRNYLARKKAAIEKARQK